MVSARTLLALLVGLAILTHPIVGDAPGLDTQYTYEATPVDLDDGETVQSLYHLPEVAYGVASQKTAVEQAANDTVTRPVSDVPPEVERLTDVRFLADDVGDRYYRVDARIDGDTFTLDATAVDARTVAAALAVAPADAPAVVRDALDGNATSSEELPATLVRTDGGYVLVRATGTTQVADPLTIPKLALYAVGISLLVWAALAFYRERSET
ncbi:hypothetical protein EFA46_008920 [Halarchaeum sp. CBA1220]|uniref:hypothetical protein n=1 Tax=Halarchaeum sp. CBA1220 TaxID=1853682 RepID=UPI000F3A8418|nr:hypothetical protein [Halarchaeum sp. CBA1220]QLC34322.1 hypothetical protein EFA46_008920 [Halarchaeum sp. CBA1220]